MFGLFSLLILLVAIIWVYQDGLSLRKKGVPVNPGLVAGLIVLGEYFLSFTIGFLPYFLGLLIPIFVYLFLRFTQYQKSAALGNPPLPPARRWGFWFMLATIFVPVIFIFLSFSYFFRGGW